ncbi:MAG: calcium:proton antiporter [Rhodobacteraceae bacterium]|nr:calcium:proton antiporter [Paracoccaceae bacterium]
MATVPHERTPLWAIVVPLAAAAVVGLKMAHVLSAEDAWVLGASALLLGGSVFAAVHHAEVLALKLGEPFGSILLAVAVTVIEVALIVSILLTRAPGSEAVARDTVSAAVMIVLNGIVGVCLVAGALRHREQVFRVDGAQAPLAVLSVLAIFALVLPNFTTSTREPTYAPLQLAGIATVFLVLYAVFVFVQTVRHRDYFLDPPIADEPAPEHGPPSTAVALASLFLLFVALSAVVLLAKVLSQPLDDAVRAAGLPHAVVGVAIAAVVLLPEGLAATRAALGNRLQGAINLAIGSAIASIGLTIPVVAAVTLWLGLDLTLGLTPEKMVLLLMTLLVATQTLATGRTTVLQGAVHLVIFAVFILLTLIP